MLQELGDAKRRIVGAKQVLRALGLGEVSHVFAARDADHKVLQPIRDRCAELGVAVTEIDTMAQLGAACHIQVGSAAAALRKP